MKIQQIQNGVVFRELKIQILYKSENRWRRWTRGGGIWRLDGRNKIKGRWTKPPTPLTCAARSIADTFPFVHQQ